VSTVVMQPGGPGGGDLVAKQSDDLPILYCSPT